MPKQLLFFAAFFTALSAFSQDSLTRHSAGSGASSNSPVYTIKPKVDIPVFAAAAGWAFYGFSKISKKDGASQATVVNLQKSNIPLYDRWAVRPYNTRVPELPYLPSHSPMPYPLLS